MRRAQTYSRTEIQNVHVSVEAMIIFTYPTSYENLRETLEVDGERGSKFTSMISHPTD